MRAILPLAGLLLLTATVSQGADAPFGRIRRSSTTLDATSRGDGRLEIGHDTSRPLDRVTVLLRRGGSADLRFYRGSTPYVFTGRWSGDPSRQVDLQLTQRDNVPIRASGTVYLQHDNEVSRIEIDGRQGSDRLGVSFQTSDGGSTSAVSDLSRANRGAGRLEIGRDTNRPLDRVTLSLRRSGAADLRFYRGSTPYVFTGQWTGDPSRRVDLELTRRDNVAVRATGRAYFGHDSELTRIEVNGDERGKRLYASFRVEGSSGSGGPFDYIRKSDETPKRQGHQEK